MPIANTPSKADVEARLASLRDKPVGSGDGGENVLFPIYSYLMAVPGDVTDGNVHWFCPKAESVTVEAATFLIRLFAYDSDNVKAWKARFEKCLAGCSRCVQGLEEVKVSSRHT
jgi:senataxin